jgi:hypothetical protein
MEREVSEYGIGLNGNGNEEGLEQNEEYGGNEAEETGSEDAGQPRSQVKRISMSLSHT